MLDFIIQFSELNIPFS